VTADQPRSVNQPLPVRVRPVAGEGAESYIRRLARANHLKPSYLRRYLATPRAGYGPIHPDQLAAVAGRTLNALQRALPDLRARQPHRQPPRRQHAEDAKRRNQARKRALFTAIRRDAAAGLSRRALERKHNVGRRTVVKALASASPPERKKPNRPPTVHGLHHHIDVMIDNNPAVPASEVWAHLVDHHDTTVSYGAIRAYVTRRKAERDRAVHNHISSSKIH
jgi:TniQ